MSQMRNMAVRRLIRIQNHIRMLFRGVSFTLTVKISAPVDRFSSLYASQKRCHVQRKHDEPVLSADVLGAEYVGLP